MNLQQWLFSLPFRLRSWLHSSEVDQEMKAEIGQHLDQQIRENVTKGMLPEEARRSAIVALGGITQIEQQCRDDRSADP